MHASGAAGPAAMGTDPSRGLDWSVSDFTRLLGAIERGEASTSKDLLPLVYEELRRLAGARLSQERAGQTLTATALVHEAFVRLSGGEDGGAEWNGKGHFFAAAAESMRRILVDRARQKKRRKHGGDRQRLSLDGLDVAASELPEDLLDLHEALARLAEEDPTKAKLVELRFFAGLTMAQASRVLGISMPTAERFWAYSRAWLFDEMTRVQARGDG